MKPLTLREVAEAIEMHESTVSRVTQNKYLLCDRGLFELKYFFGSGVGSGDGEGAAAEAVKAAIGKLIAAETTILSDDDTRRIVQDPGLRCRPAHGRQISRSDGHRLIDPAAAAAEDGWRLEVAPARTFTMLASFGMQASSSLTSDHGSASRAQIGR